MYTCICTYLILYVYIICYIICILYYIILYYIILYVIPSLSPVYARHGSTAISMLAVNLSITRPAKSRNTSNHFKAIFWIILSKGRERERERSY